MIGAILAATVLFAQAEPAATPAQPASTAAAAPNKTVSPAVVTGRRPGSVPNPNEVVCQSEPVLGTLFPKKTCATRQELNDRRREDQKQTREATNLRPYKLTDGIGP